MKAIFLDHDGVICLPKQYGSRNRKLLKAKTEEEKNSVNSIFDNFDPKAIKTLNGILEISNAEIIVSSDWRLYCTLEEMQEYYKSKGIIKSPIAFTEDILGGISENKRVCEILKYLELNPQITHWVAIDDLNLGFEETVKYVSHSKAKVKRNWGLSNFVQTNEREGIKQCGIKEKILKYLI